MGDTDRSIEGMLAQAMANPEIQGLLSRMQSEQKQTGGEGASDPMAHLPEMIEALRRSGIGLPGQEAAGKSEPDAPPGGGGGGHREQENRRRLLGALKPYLNPARKDAVDSILKVTQLTDLLGGTHHSEKRDGTKGAE